MLELTFANKLRSPDAWWRRALGIIEGSQPDTTCRTDGRLGRDWINRAIDFENGLAAAKTHRERMDVADRNPGIWLAKFVFEQQAPNGQALRSAIEARILARQTDEQIAQCTGCTPAAIAAYEALFFNVRNRLENGDFITQCVIGAPAARAKDEPVGRVWKQFGYRAGPHVLEAVLGGLSAGQIVESPDDVSKYLDVVTAETMQQKAAVAAATIQVQEKTSFALIKSVKAGRNTNSASLQLETLQVGLQQLLEAIPYTVIGQVEEKQLSEFDQNAAELRTEELQFTALGYQIPGMELLKTLKFPEPPSGP